MSLHINSLPRWPLFPALIVACLLNYYAVPYFTGSELIFGNVIAVIVLFIYGLLPAVIISVVAGSAAYFNWGYVFNILPFLVEILVLHWAIRGSKNPIYIGILYWALFGWMIVGIEVFFFSDFEILEKYVITIKYVINGLINVLLGYVIAQYIITKTKRGTLGNRKRISVLLTNQLFYIVAITVIVISFLWFKAIEREKLNDYQRLMRLQAVYVSTEVENYIISHQSALVISALNNGNVSDPVKIQQVLQHFKNTYPTVLTLLSTDENGDVMATSPQNLLDKMTISGNTNVADRSYFQEVKKSGKPFISNVFEGRGFGTDSIVALSVPLTNDQGFVGIIEASLDLKLLKELDRKEIAPEEGLIILDQNNRAIYASENLNHGFLKDLSESKLIKHLSEPDDYYLQDEIGNYLIVQSVDSESLGLKIITTLPRSVYYSSISYYMSIALSVLGLLIIFSFFFARWAVRIITQPFNALSIALSDAKNAEDLLNIKLTTDAQELIEITNVEQKLNEFAIRSKQLMSDLKQAKINQDIAHDQLLDINENLEQIVASQTDELNTALRKANEANDLKDEAKNFAEQAAREKADFLATMSHEIRTPMNGVLGMTELLSSTSLNVIQKNYVETILSSGNLLLTIINDILDYSKLEAGKVELEIVPINLEPLLHDMLEMMNMSLTKDIELILDYPPTVPAVFMGDPTRLSQILFNLVGNAIKFTKYGSVSILARFDGQNLTIEVKDTGIGITDEQKKTLFRSFIQADTSTTRIYGGTGLGLAISRSLINLMDGEITIQSEYGKGTSFTMTLGLAAEIKPEPEKIFNKTNILVVESNNNYFKIYSDLLHYYGANVTQCLEIESLVDLLLCAKAGEPELDVHLVLISANLSAVEEQKYGMELRSHLELKNMPIVIFSRSSRKANLEHYFSSGFTAYFTKPIRSDLLIAGLKASIEHKDTTSLITKHSLTNSSQYDAAEIQFSGHVLLVEDVLTNQIVARTMLSNMGLTVDLAEDGLQAIKQWQKKHYDLIFMDCRMPNMDGYEATRHIRSKEHSEKTPIIALTANATEEDQIKCNEAGMDAMVTKPFRPCDLHKVLFKWLDADAKILEPSEEGQANAVHVLAIDIEIFEKNQQMLGDAFPEFVDSIFNDVDNILRELSNWNGPLDIEGLALLPHSLKSCSAYIGATKLRQLAEKCENDAREGKVEKALSYVNEMHRAYEDVIKELVKLGYNKPSGGINVINGSDSFLG
jgi:signal transduction histidine kinase/CheY-like chemotaxis protein/HPt (histidine-containing phosphotransfer) domain-containing protein